MVLEPIGVPQGEDQVRELAPLEFGDELFVLFVGELAGVVFEDGLGRFAGGCVKEHDRCHVFAKRLGNAGYLPGQDPHRDAVVPGTKPEIDQLTRATFTSLEAAQSSSINRVLVPAKKKLASRSQVSISCCGQAITKMCGSRSTKPS